MADAPRMYRKTALVLARQYVQAGSADVPEIVHWCGGSWTGGDDPVITVPTLEGPLEARPGDWILKGTRDEFWPVRQDIFAETYEPADDVAGEAVSTESAPEPPLPPGQFVRVELPGYRQHTGWMTEETRAGAGVLVIRDWNGAVEAEVFPGAGCRIVHLPTPQKRPDASPQLAISGRDFIGQDDPDDDPYDRSY